MSQKARSKQKKNDPFWIALYVAMGLVVLLFILDPNSQTKVPPRKVSEQLQERRRVNDYLQKMDRDQNLRRLAVKIENAKSAPPVLGQNLKDLAHEALPDGVDLSQESWSQERLHDMRKVTKDPDYRVDIDASVQAQLVQQQNSAEYDRLFREEFVKSFVRKAAEEGFTIAVDKNLNVQIIGYADPNEGRAPQSVRPEKVRCEDPLFVFGNLSVAY